MKICFEYKLLSPTIKTWYNDRPTLANSFFGFIYDRQCSNLQKYNRCTNADNQIIRSNRLYDNLFIFMNFCNHISIYFNSKNLWPTFSNFYVVNRIASKNKLRSWILFSLRIYKTFIAESKLRLWNAYSFCYFMNLRLEADGSQEISVIPILSGIRIYFMVICLFPLKFFDFVCTEFIHLHVTIFWYFVCSAICSIISAFLRVFNFSSTQNIFKATCCLD